MIRLYRNRQYGVIKTLTAILITIFQIVSSSHQTLQQNASIDTNLIQNQSGDFDALITNSMDNQYNNHIQATSSSRQLEYYTVAISPFYIKLSPSSESLWVYQMDLVEEKITNLLLYRLPIINYTRYGMLDGVELAGISSINIQNGNNPSPYTIVSVEGGVATFTDNKNIPSTSEFDNKAIEVMNNLLLFKIKEITGLESITSLEVLTGKWNPPPVKAPSKPPTKQQTNQPTRAPVQIPNSKPVKPPTLTPIKQPTRKPSHHPSRKPSHFPTKKETHHPTIEPTHHPIKQPTIKTPTLISQPANYPTAEPTKSDLTTDDRININIGGSTTNDSSDGGNNTSLIIGGVVGSVVAILFAALYARRKKSPNYNYESHGKFANHDSQRMYNISQVMYGDDDTDEEVVHASRFPTMLPLDDTLPMVDESFERDPLSSPLSNSYTLDPNLRDEEENLPTVRSRSRVLLDDDLQLFEDIAPSTHWGEMTHLDSGNSRSYLPDQFRITPTKVDKARFGSNNIRPLTPTQFMHRDDAASLSGSEFDPDITWDPDDNDPTNSSASFSYSDEMTPAEKHHFT